jgi:phage terminase small subunit
MKLSKQANKIYEDIRQEYGIDDPAGLLILQIVAESWDMYKIAEADVLKNGISLMDRYGQSKANPAASVMRDSKSQILLGLKQLNLNWEVIGNGKTLS